jgi:hypothetical protein
MCAYSYGFISYVRKINCYTLTQTIYVVKVEHS